VLKKELMAHLRTARQMRQAKSGTTKSGLGQIVDAVSIRERPAEVEDRAVPGHWGTVSPEQTTRTSPRWSSAIRAL
jgi:IS30 family transposase